MAERTQATTAEGNGTRSPEEIQREIERTRAELGETVAAVAEKADVKAQAKRKVEETKGTVKSNPAPLVIAGALVLVVAIVVVRRR